MRFLRHQAILLGTSLALLLPPPAAPAQEALDSEARREVAGLQTKVEGFFADLTDKATGPATAVRGLVADGPLKLRTEEVAKLIDQASRLEQRYGAYTGNESVAAKAVGGDLVFLRYLYKAEKFPVVWEFTYYRTETATGLKRDWTLIALKFDTQLEALAR